MLTSEDFKNSAIRHHLEQYENITARAIRGFDEPSEGQWETLENVVLRLALDAATLDPMGLPSADGRSDVPLTLLARALGNTSRNSLYSTAYLASVSALIYASAGNFATARVFASQSLMETRERGALETWALSCLSEFKMKLSRPENPDWLRSYADAQDVSLRTGRIVDFETASQSFYSMASQNCQNLVPSDSLILLLWEHISIRLRELSVARVLRDTGAFDPRYIRAILNNSSPLLFPTQVDAIEKHKIHTPGNSILLLPTSTGKSFLGELAIVASLTAEKPVGIYLAPYRALADQIYYRMRERLQDIGIRCEIRRGGYLSASTIDADKKTVVVATPEAFDALLRQKPELYRRLACCVFDEFHLIEQPIRGLRYEGLISRINAVEASGACKIVALSPVIDVTTELLDWLKVAPEKVVKSDWRPTSRRLVIASPDGIARYYSPGDELQLRPDPSQPNWSGEVAFPNPINSPPVQEYGQAFNRHNAAVTENIISVSIDQYHRFKQPILVVANTRGKTRAFASDAANKLPELDPSLPHCERIFHLVDSVSRRHPYLYTLIRCLRHGVAFHNASLPNWIREELEDLMSVRAFRIVFSTTTLAEGVDLPFRSVILSDWRQFRYGKYIAYPSLLFRNIAGRCGRAGAFPEGDTLIVDNPGNKPGSSTWGERYHEYLGLYVNPAVVNVNSSVSDSLNLDVEAARTDVRAALESQLTAYIEVSQEQTREKEELFAESLLASRNERDFAYVKTVAREFVDDMLQDSDFTVLKRNSPVVLTEFGRVVMRTGLSPRSGINLALFVQNYSPSTEPRKHKVVRTRFNLAWDSLVAAFVARTLLPEQFVSEIATGAFHSIGRRRFPINRDNLENVVLAWVLGKPIEEIALITIRSEEARQSAEEWLENPEFDIDTSFEEQIEQVSVFLNSYIGQQWSWVLKGAAEISMQMESSLSNEFQSLARRIASGVKNLGTASLLEHRCPVDRSKLDFIIERFLSVNPYGPYSYQQLSFWLNSTSLDIAGQGNGRYHSALVNSADLVALSEFLGRAPGEII